MKALLLVISFFVTLVVVAQNEGVVLNTMKTFHQVLVQRDSVAKDLIHPQLSYGHSNGWIESREAFIKNLATDYIVYHSFVEDSISVQQSGNVTQVRFVAEIEVTLNGGAKTKYRLRVLEVWVEENKSWKLYARQAVKG